MPIDLIYLHLYVIALGCFVRPVVAVALIVPVVAVSVWGNDVHSARATTVLPTLVTFAAPTWGQRLRWRRR